MILDTDNIRIWILEAEDSVRHILNITDSVRVLQQIIKVQATNTLEEPAIPTHTSTEGHDAISPKIPQEDESRDFS